MTINLAATHDMRCQRCNTLIHRDDDGAWRDRACGYMCPAVLGVGHRPLAGRHRDPADGFAAGTADYPPRHTYPTEAAQ